MGNEERKKNTNLNYTGLWKNSLKDKYIER